MSYNFSINLVFLFVKISSSILLYKFFQYFLGKLTTYKSLNIFFKLSKFSLLFSREESLLSKSSSISCILNIFLASSPMKSNDNILDFITSTISINSSIFLLKLPIFSKEITLNLLKSDDDKKSFSSSISLMSFQSKNSALFNTSLLG